MEVFVVVVVVVGEQVGWMPTAACLGDDQNDVCARPCNLVIIADSVWPDAAIINYLINQVIANHSYREFTFTVKLSSILQ